MTEKIIPIDKVIKSFVERSISAIRSKDALALRKVSSDAISEAAVDQHRELILLGLVDYGLSKMLSKTHYQEVNSKFYEEILEHFRSCLRGDKENLLFHLEAIEDMVIKLDETHGHYTENLIEQAKVKKASNLYYKGISLRRSAELMGIDEARLMDYVGSGRGHELKEGGSFLKRRISNARRVFPE
jgi:hypothetical protein